MTIVVEDLFNEVRIATNIQGSNTSPETSLSLIVNQAIAYFNAMHAWDSMVVEELPMDSVAGQPYIALPADTRDVLSFIDSENTTNWTKWVTPEKLTRLRAYDENDEDFVGGYYLAIESATPAEGGGLDRRIGLYPEPAASQVGIFVMRYRRKLLDVGTEANPDTQYVHVSTELEHLLRMLVRIHAKGIEEEDEGNLIVRLEQLEGSSYLSRIKEAEAAMQPEVGITEGGAAQRPHYYHGRAWWDTAILPPL